MYVITEDDMDAIQAVIDTMSLTFNLAAKIDDGRSLEITSAQVCNLTGGAVDALREVLEIAAAKNKAAAPMVREIMATEGFDLQRYDGLCALGAADPDGLRAMLGQHSGVAGHRPRDAAPTITVERKFPWSDGTPLTDARIAALRIKRVDGNFPNELFLSSAAFLRLAQNPEMRQYFPNDDESISVSLCAQIFGVSRVTVKPEAPTLRLDAVGQTIWEGEAVLAYVPPVGKGKRPKPKGAGKR